MKTSCKGGVVSVVIPAYNRVRTIVRALDSVYAQTYRPIELIVIDDGSTDGTQGVVEDWVEAYETDELHVVVLPGDHRGAAAARNAGIRVASGDWVAFLDSDDWWEPEKLATCLAAIHAEPGYGLWYSSSRQVDGRTGTVERVMDRGFNGNHRERLKKVNPITAFSSIAIQRDMLLAIGGFDEQMPARQDTELYYRLAEQVEFGFIPAMLVNVSAEAENRISASLACRMKGWILFYEKHGHSFSFVDKLYHQKRILWYALHLRDFPLLLRYGLGGLTHFAINAVGRMRGG